MAHPQHYDDASKEELAALRGGYSKHNDEFDASPTSQDGPLKWSHLFAQLANLTFTIFLWRGLWMWEDKVMALRAFKGTRGASSISIGILLLGGMSATPCLRAEKWLPVSNGVTVGDKLARLVYLMVVLAGVACFWRGWWLLLDNLANEIGSTMDITVMLTTGIIGVGILNLTPQLAPKLSGYEDSIFNN